MAIKTSETPTNHFWVICSTSLFTLYTLQGNTFFSQFDCFCTFLIMKLSKCICAQSYSEKAASLFKAVFSLSPDIKLHNHTVNNNNVKASPGFWWVMCNTAKGGMRAVTKLAIDFKTLNFWLVFLLIVKFTLMKLTEPVLWLIFFLIGYRSRSPNVVIIVFLP